MRDLERLTALVSNEKRPVQFLYAGKAHPRDTGGQDLIRALHEFSLQPRFSGRLFLIENYDIALARHLVTGVDIWLNNPEYPLEASGTSGMKAAMNGAVHLSILDGWWAEGYTGDNGYGIAPMGHQLPEHERNRLEAEEICRVLFEVAKPSYFDRGWRGHSESWVRLAKASQRTVLPRFNAERQVLQYTENFYAPAARHARSLVANDYAQARALATWKQRIRAAWPEVTLRLVEGPPAALSTGGSFRLTVAVGLVQLQPEDITLECQLGSMGADGEFNALETHPLAPIDGEATPEMIYALTLQPRLSGLAALRLRAFPAHSGLAHRFEMGCMRWL